MDEMNTPQRGSMMPIDLKRGIIMNYLNDSKIDQTKRDFALNELSTGNATEDDAIDIITTKYGRAHYPDEFKVSQPEKPQEKGLLGTAWDMAKGTVTSTLDTAEEGLNKVGHGLKNVAGALSGDTYIPETNGQAERSVPSGEDGRDLMNRFQQATYGAGQAASGVAQTAAAPLVGPATPLIQEATKGYQEAFDLLPEDVREPVKGAISQALDALPDDVKARAGDIAWLLPGLTKKGQGVVAKEAEVFGKGKQLVGEGIGKAKELVGTAKEAVGEGISSAAEKTKLRKPLAVRAKDNLRKILTPEVNAKNFKEAADKGLAIEGQKGGLLSRTIPSKIEFDPAMEKHLETLQKYIGDKEALKLTPERVPKTVKDLIPKISKKVDEAFAKDTSGGHSIKSFEKTIGEGKSAVKVNYVKQAMEDLKNFYEKTGNHEGIAKIKKLENNSKIKGLTYKDVNDLARLHGRELNAYNANNELASGLSKQAAENTRKGLKTTAREGLGTSEAKALDEELSQLFDIEEAVRGDLKPIVKSKWGRIPTLAVKTAAIPVIGGTAYGLLKD